MNGYQMMYQNCSSNTLNALSVAMVVFSERLVIRLSSGHIISVDIIVNAPQLRGDMILSFQPQEATVSVTAGNQPSEKSMVCIRVMPTPHIKQNQQAVFVILLE